MIDIIWFRALRLSSENSWIEPWWELFFSYAFIQAGHCCVNPLFRCTTFRNIFIVGTVGWTTDLQTWWYVQHWNIFTAMIEQHSNDNYSWLMLSSSRHWSVIFPSIFWKYLNITLVRIIPLSRHRSSISCNLNLCIIDSRILQYNSVANHSIRLTLPLISLTWDLSLHILQVTK